MIYVFAMLAIAASIEFSVESSLTFDVSDAKNRPVSKVIKLLKDMMKTMEKEGEGDQESYDKLTCWFITNDKDKTKSIADAKSRVADLTTSIEDKTAKSARLNTEAKNLKKEVAEDQHALDTATAIRLKQLAEFTAEEKDLLMSTSSVKNAVVVLSKHTAPGSFLQSAPGHLNSVAITVEDAIQKHSQLLAGVLTPTQRRAVSAFVQAPKYAPQSGEIFGIMNQMKETFETNLQNSQKDEKTNLNAFQELKTAKEAEIKAGQDQADTKSEQLADTNDQLAQDQQDLSDTKKSLAADEKFLANLKEERALNDSEWDLRQKERSEEMEATSKALAVLSSDDAHELVTRTFNPSFLQTDMQSDRRAQVSKLLSAVAQKVQNPRLAALAVHVRLDAFTKVRKAIDEMLVQLAKEKADEIKQRDFCISEFDKNTMATTKKSREKEDVTALIAKQTATIKRLTEAVAALQADISEMQKQVKTAGEDREKQSKEFQLTVADQRATQKLLNSALNILKGFYAKKAAAALVQAKPRMREGRPAGFDTHKKNSSSGGVMGMLTQIVSDAKAMEVEAVHDEEQAVKAYKAFVTATNESIATKSDDIANKKGTLAEQEAAKVASTTDLGSVSLELEQLANTKAELHESCDFTMKNFEVRQSARVEEAEALKQAKSILSGAKFEAFLKSE